MNVERTKHKNLVLILARELASNIATPMFVVDPDGTLIFYNEPGEVILGQSFAHTGELSPDQWGTLWKPETLAGDAIPADALPLTVALQQRQPSYQVMRITGLDGSKRVIGASAFPLFSKVSEFAGAVAVFWEYSDTDRR